MRLMHAVQTGVKSKMQYDPHETQPAHLRVGVNSAMIEFSALLDVLIEKKILTLEEFEVSLVKWAKKEVETYEKELSDHHGTKITLG